MENSSTWEDEKEVNDNELQATLGNRLCIRKGGGRLVLTTYKLSNFCCTLNQQGDLSPSILFQVTR